MKILITGGRVVDPSRNVDRMADIIVADGKIAGMEETGCVSIRGFDRIVDASGCLVVPGLIDMHVHFREPGQEYKETIASGCAAAAAGGFTTVCCMPNTQPVLDSPESMQFIHRKAAEANGVRVLPAAAVTEGQLGLRLNDFRALKKAGAAAFSEDGRSVDDPAVMREAFRLAAEIGMPILDHTEQSELKDGGCMRRGSFSSRTGLPGIPPEAEPMIAIRDILLARETGAKLHLQHISSKLSLDLIRLAKQEWKMNITAETAPHYFTLIDENVIVGGGRRDIYHRSVSPKGVTVDSHRKMNPPLGTHNDRDAVIRAMLDGTLDVIATDHAPHSPQEKALPFAAAPFGVIGLETSFAVSYTEMVEKHGMEPMQLIRMMSTKPAEILNCGGGTLEGGSRADLAVIDVIREFEIPDRGFASKAENTPFAGMKVKGDVRMTMAGGRIIFEK